jgi:broad specificity phosphatase PhoE
MLPSRSFLFMRHGETDWNREGRFQSLTDIALNAAGLAQARDAAERLTGAGVTCIVTSPLMRALKTAGTIGERLECPIRIDSQLSERAFGAFEGRIVREVKQELGVPPEVRLHERGLLPPDAEQWAQTVERTIAVVGKWLERLPSDTLLFVSHTGLFEALCVRLCGTRFEGKHAVPYRFTPPGDRWAVSEMG